MIWTISRLRTIALALLCVMLLAALAPTVSRARAWSEGSPVVWVEVCTADGARQIKLENSPDDAPVKPMGMSEFDHCAFCTLAADRLAPPPAPLAWHAAPKAPPLLARVLTLPPQTVLHWTVHSRAPPAHA